MTVIVSAPDPVPVHCRPTPLPETPKYTSASLLSLLWVSAPFFWLLVRISFVCALQESLFPHCLGSSVIKSHWPSKSDCLGILSPFAGSPDWEVCCGAENFLSSTWSSWYNCSPVCELPMQRLYSGANSNLLQEDLCHMLPLPGLLLPEPL